jgi:hypothetical protein
MVLNTEHQSLLDGVRGDTAERAAQQIQARRQSLDTERTLRQLQARQRKGVLTDRICTLQTQLRQADEEQHLQQRRLQLAQTSLSRNEQLAAAGFVAAAQVQTRQEELIDAQARVQSAHRMRLGLVQDLQSLQGERQALTAQLQADLNQLDRRLCAPRADRVCALCRLPLPKVWPAHRSHHQRVCHAVCPNELPANLAPQLTRTRTASPLQSDLLALECANLIEQRTLYKFPHLSRHAQAIGMLDAGGFRV